MCSFIRTETPKTNQSVPVFAWSRGKNRKFRFNRKKYDEMKEKGIFKIEF